MGIIKGIGKVLGTTVLTATGVASTVLKGVFDTVGVELGSEVFGAAKDASFNGIRNMWDSESAQNRIDKAEKASYTVEDTTRRQMADTAYKMAQIAKKMAIWKSMKPIWPNTKNTDKEVKNMAVLFRKYRQTIHWRCSCCGRTADSSVKPGMTYGGRCNSAPNGMHRWVKDHF